MQVFKEKPLTYTISQESDGKIIHGNVPRPKVLPVAGQVIKFNQACVTLANVTYDVGDTLILIGRTSTAPHGKSSLGNWLVKCKHFVSVWTNIEWGLAGGLLSIDGEKNSKEDRLMKVRHEGQFEIYENESLGVRIARPRRGALWTLSDINNVNDFDQDMYRHDLAERYDLTLEIQV